MSRASRRLSSVPERGEGRAEVRGTVWLPAQGQMVPAGRLLDFSEGGIRFRHDPESTDQEGFPVPAPRVGETVSLAVTLRPGEQLKTMHAKVLRVTLLKDGGVEVACQFQAGDAREMKAVHRKYVDASLQRARESLAAYELKLQGRPSAERGRRRALGQILVSRKAIGEKELEGFLESNQKGIRLGEALLGAGLVTPRQLAEALSEHFGIPFVDLKAIQLDPRCRSAIALATAKRLNVLPFGLKSRDLEVAVARPLTVLERAELERESRRRVVQYLVDADQLAGHLHGISVRKRRRAQQRLLTKVLVRYRIYGAAMQLCDERVFRGAVVNLSESGILVTGPVPGAVLAEAQEPRPPRFILAMQLFIAERPDPVLLRFESVRITPLGAGTSVLTAPPQPEEAGAPQGWLGGRISPLVAADQRNLLELVKSLGGGR